MVPYTQTFSLMPYRIEQLSQGCHVVATDKDIIDDHSKGKVSYRVGKYAWVILSAKKPLRLQPLYEGPMPLHTRRPLPV